VYTPAALPVPAPVAGLSSLVFLSCAGLSSFVLGAVAFVAGSAFFSSFFGFSLGSDDAFSDDSFDPLAAEPEPSLSVESFLEPSLSSEPVPVPSSSPVPSSPVPSSPDPVPVPVPEPVPSSPEPSS